MRANRLASTARSLSSVFTLRLDEHTPRVAPRHGRLNGAAAAGVVGISRSVLVRLAALILALVCLPFSYTAKGDSLSDVRVLVYSTSAAEAFWQRANPTDRVEASLDGEVIGLLNASSVFLDGLALKRGHELTLRSRSADGPWSSTATVRFDTEGFSSPPRQYVAEPPVAGAAAPVTSASDGVSIEEVASADDAGCAVTNVASLSTCTALARANDLPVGPDGLARIRLDSDIECDSNCCPGGNALLNLNGARNLVIDGTGMTLTRHEDQRRCSLLTLHQSDGVQVRDLVLDDDETDAACVVDDGCPRMVHARDARNIAFRGSTVRHAKGYAIYIQGTDGFHFENSRLEHSGVLGLYIGHEDDASQGIVIRNSTFLDNATNALALLGVTGGGGTNQVVDNVFERNHAVGQWPVAARYGTGLTGGGQVYLARAFDVRFANNRIADGHCNDCYWHGPTLRSGVTGLELGKPGQRTVGNLLIENNTIVNNDAYGVAANVTSPIDSTVKVIGNTLSGNGANWRLGNALLLNNQVD